MCGILGLYSYDERDLIDREFDSVVDSLSHRGPDGRGVYRDQDVALRLGHRRLKILDLSPAASQPMTILNGRYWIVFNGEVYNFIELRKELELEGFSFKTETDTEVILASYLVWGESCQLKFNGMWAFAIWDSQDKTLFLSRDRFGVKPLHYFNDGRRFGFSSEIKAFLSLNPCPLEFDAQTVADTIFDPTSLESTDRTLFTGVKRLQAGHSAIFHHKKGLKIRRWWNTLDHLPLIPNSFGEQVEGFRSLFLDACRIRMRSDVPIGTALSGGLDSSSVVAALAKLSVDPQAERSRWSNDWQKTFTALFPGTSQDEFLYAKEATKNTNANPIYYTIDSAELILHLEKTLFQLEEIFDLPIGPWLIYREFRKNSAVISIDGHGADEILGGYHHQAEAALIESILYNPNLKRIAELRELSRGLYPEGSPYRFPSLSWILSKHISGKLSRSSLYHFLRKIGAKIKGNTDRFDWFRRVPQYRSSFETINDPKFKELSYLNQVLYRDFHQNTLPTILRNFDRCSMAHGIEVRAPFMDWRVVCFSFALPSNSKIGAGYTKRILRESMKGHVPELIRTRKAKVGFASPMIEWLQGGLKSYFLDAVSRDSFLSSSIWDGPAIRQHLERSIKAGDYSSARQSWEFIQADRLMELFKKKKAENSSKTELARPAKG